SFLPDGRAVLFTIVSAGPIENSQIAVLDLKTGTRKTLVQGGFHAQYVDPGYIVYATPGVLRAVRFDPQKLQILGDSVPAADHVMTASNGAAEFSLSRRGALLYVSGDSLGSAIRSLMWVDRQGRTEPISAAPPHAYFYPRLSPDGRQAALDIREANNDLW